MNIKPIYTLDINNGDEYISSSAEVKVKAENGLEYKGLFLSCDSGGIELEIGAEESNVIYLLYCEIESIGEL